MTRNRRIIKHAKASIGTNIYQLFVNALKPLIRLKLCGNPPLSRKCAELCAKSGRDEHEGPGAGCGR